MGGYVGGASWRAQARRLRPGRHSVSRVMLGAVRPRPRESVGMTSAPQATTQPNIIFIMADDMGYGDPGCYGATKVPTPNMDRLAAEGVRFTDAHSTSAVCTPSRYGVLTGRYCWRSRLQRWVLWGHSQPLIEEGRLTVASMLKQHGYATAAIGKWHLGLGWHWTTDGVQDDDNTEDGSNIDYTKPIAGGPLTRGFDHFFGISGSLDMPPYCFIQGDRTVGVPDREKEPYNPQQRKGLMVEGWQDEKVDVTFAQEACSFIREHREAKPDEPFFLYLTPSAPHRPCVVPAFMAGRSQAGPRGDMVCLVDWMLGQIMQTLDGLGIADNTLVMLTSDNGARPADVDGDTHGHKSCGDWRGHKADIWDGGHREPFVARWPGRIPPGSVSDEPVCLTDLMATCAAIIDHDLPDDAGEDSHNLLPAMVGEDCGAPIREALVHHSGDGMFSIRQGPWKLILGLGSGGFSQPRREEPQPDGAPGQLYNMDDDPAETTNLYGKRRDVVERLTALLDAYKQHGRSAPGRGN